MAEVVEQEIEQEPAEAAHDDRRADIEAAFAKHTEEREPAAEAAPAQETAPEE